MLFPNLGRMRMEELRQANFFVYYLYNSGIMGRKNLYCSISHFKVSC